MSFLKMLKGLFRILMDLFFSRKPDPALLKQLGERDKLIAYLGAVRNTLEEEINILMAKLANGVFLRGGLTGDIPSPRVPIKESDVIYNKVTKTLLIKNLPGVTISTVQGTNSMEPSLDVGHMTINSDDPKYMDSIKIGSVITFDAGNGQRVIHPVVDVSEFEGETVYGTQGWNINKPDSYTIYKEQIESVCLFVIWAEKFYSYIPEEGD